LIYDYSKANWKKFRCLIEKLTDELKENCCELNTSLKIDNCVKLMNDGISKATEESIPKKNPFVFRYKFSQKIHNLTRGKTCLFRPRADLP
jgi:hypothetical protein